MKISHTAPMLACDDVDAALTFCAERLGFERAWTWNDPPSEGGARPWELREYSVRLPAGQLLRFAEGLEHIRERERAAAGPS